MITGILAFFQAVPAIMGGINNFTSAYFNAKVQLTAARIGGDVEVVRAMLTATGIEAQSRVEGLKVIAGSKVLLFLVFAFAMPWVLYEWRVVVWDNVIMLGTTSTPPIKGEVGSWATTIISCLFGSGTAVTVGSMYFHRNKAGE
jgi:hypothetical protein